MFYVYPFGDNDMCPDGSPVRSKHSGASSSLWPLLHCWCVLSAVAVSDCRFWQLYFPTRRGTLSLEACCSWVPEPWPLDCWIRRVCADDQALFPWSPMSPDLMPCDFYLWGYLKDHVCVPPLPRTLVPLKEHINNAVMAIYEMMFQNVWNELDYRLDTYCVTKGHT